MPALGDPTAATGAAAELARGGRGGRHEEAASQGPEPEVSAHVL